MTMQTTTPLVHQSLNATNRGAQELARLAVKGQMTLDAPYQRGSVWTVEQRRNLVRSWLLGLPIPAVIINDRPYKDGAPSFACVDGKQRIEAAIAWFTGDLAVPASWFPQEKIASTLDTEDGPYVTYDTLTVPGQRYTSNRFLIPVASSNVRTIAEEAAIFGLVNGGGVPQDAETLERAAKIAEGR